MSDYYEAKELFSRTLGEEMDKAGYAEDFSTYTHKEAEDTIHRCVDEAYQSAWDEFVAWVTCGDDKKERTRMLVKGLSMGGAMFR